MQRPMHLSSLLIHMAGVIQTNSSKEKASSPVGAVLPCSLVALLGSRTNGIPSAANRAAGAQRHANSMKLLEPAFKVGNLEKKETTNKPE